MLRLFCCAVESRSVLASVRLHSGAVCLRRQETHTCVNNSVWIKLSWQIPDPYLFFLQCVCCSNLSCLLIRLLLHSLGLLFCHVIASACCVAASCLSMTLPVGPCLLVLLCYTASACLCQHSCAPFSYFWMIFSDDVLLRLGACFPSSSPAQIWKCSCHRSEDRLSTSLVLWNTCVTDQR